MQALRAYLRMRGLTLGRQLRELGWLRLMVLGFMGLLTAGRALVLAAQHPLGQWAVPAVLLGLVWGAHRQRADLLFLRTVAPGFRPWLAVEYGLLALPAALMLLAFGAVGPALLTQALPPATAWANAGQEMHSTTQRPRSLFRSEAFEWVSGVRVSRAWLLWPSLLALALWQREAPLGPLAALVVWLFVVLACYGVPEPATMVALAARSAGRFLRRRLALGLGYGLLTSLPFLWILGNGPAGLGGAVAVGLAWLVLLGLLILIKYAFYPNGLQVRFTQGALLAVALTLPGHPVYPALLLVAIVGLLWQSRHRIRQQLGEQN